MFDERIDREELDKLQSNATGADPLMDEIAEEEKIGEIVAEQDE